MKKLFCLSLFIFFAMFVSFSLKKLPAQDKKPKQDKNKVIVNKEQPKQPEIKSIILKRPEAKKWITRIDGQKIVQHAKIMSSSEFQGREAGSKGARKTAIYISEQFREAGLLPGGPAGSYFRPFKIEGSYSIESEMDVHLGKKEIAELKRGVDYVSIYLPSGKANVKASCILAGYGITAPALKFDEYANINAKGKVVIIFSGIPRRSTNNTLLKLPTHVGTVQYKVDNAIKHGAVGVMIVENPSGWRKQLKIIERLKAPDLNFPIKSTIPVVQITRESVAQITMLSLEEIRLLALDIAEDHASQSMLLPGRMIHYQAHISGKAWIGRNIVGILPGSDKKLKSQAIVLGAHYDHLGESSDDYIYFGANDNAAGVGIIIHLARAFAALPVAPKRTIIFVCFDAEEIGRIGSRRYVKQPPIAVTKTVFMINFDMVGCNGPKHIYAVATRSSPELHKLHHQVNELVGLDIENPNSYRLGRSDHTAFYYAGIPIMYLFGGLNGDYHTPQDTWDKLIPGKLEKVARLAFLTAWEIAERQQKITFEERQD